MACSKDSIQPPRGNSPAIQSHGGFPVKWGLGISLAISCASLNPLASFAREAAVSSPAKVAVKARWFGAKVLKRSTSKRVLLMELGQAPGLPPSDPTLTAEERTKLPAVGRIVLLKMGDKPVLGVRIIKHYPEPNRFAVRRVQLYGSRETLAVGEVLTALEKVGEIPIPESVPAITARDEADLKELESIPIPTAPVTPPPPPAEAASANPSVPDPMGATRQSNEPQSEPELELAPPPAPIDEVQPTAAERPPSEAPPETPPPEQPPEAPVETPEEEPKDPPPPPDSAQNEQEEEDDSRFHSNEDLDEDSVEISVQESVIFDPHRHAVTLGYGMITNGASYWSSAGVRYAMTVGRSVFVKRSKTIQDTMALEGGLYFYRLDQNSVISTIGTARYNLWAGPNFSPFLYGGLLFNYASPGAGGTEDSAASATGLGIALGAGLMYQFAPQWELRIDLGIDMIGAGLMLRF